MDELVYLYCHPELIFWRMSSFIPGIIYGIVFCHHIQMIFEVCLFFTVMKMGIDQNT